MSKILKTILIGAYGALFLQFLHLFNMDRYETVVELNYVIKSPGLMKRMVREMKKNRNATMMDYNFRPSERLPTDMKFILKLTERFYEFRGEAFYKKQQAFIDEHCEYSNCYFTFDTSLLTDLRNFDAVVFDQDSYMESPPMIRAPHQRYIFTALETNKYYPMCDPDFEDFFNWTWSFRLDSDIIWSYFTVFDKDHRVIGPKINMTWINPMAPAPQSVLTNLAKKQKMAAWFVSDCHTHNDRMKLAYEIRSHLELQGWRLDIFGKCGSLICPSNHMEDCLELLEREYYFYFAFENSMVEDYVTEKVLHALLHYTVPVVYGGADYSRFLPPGSYIDAGKLKPYVTASLMIEAVTTSQKSKYHDFFRWRNYYIYEETSQVSDVCGLCELLNKNTETSVKHNFRHWWNPNFRNECNFDVMEQRVQDLEKQHKVIKLSKKHKIPRNENAL